MIFGKETFRRGHDCDRAAERLGELDRLFLRAGRPQLAADHQYRLAFATQKLSYCRDGASRDSGSLGFSATTLLIGPGTAQGAAAMLHAISI